MPFHRSVIPTARLLLAARHFAFAACSLAVAGAAGPAARAQDQPWDFTLTVENDFFGGTDRHYTNGLRLAWEEPFKTLGRNAPRFPRLPRLGLVPAAERTGFALGQNMYTPENTASRELLPHDRPYAGWLYLGRLYSRLGEVSDGTTVIDDFELSLGVVGPLAGAGEVQREWHRLIRNALPRGWAFQLHNEPTVQLRAARTLRILLTEKAATLSADLLPKTGIALGNVFINGNAGARARFGFNLPVDTARPISIQSFKADVAAATLPSELTAAKLPAGVAVPPPPQPKFSAYVFCGAEGRAVARNLFLDGNTWRDSHRVDKEHFVAEFTAGVAARIRRFELTYTYVRRTREFAGGPDHQDFASITLGCRH